VRYLEMLSFPGVCWYVLHDGECGKTSLFRAVRYDEEESVHVLYKIHEGFAETNDYMVAIGEQTHRIYLPVQDVHGRPLLRKAIVCSPDRPVPDAETEYEQTPFESEGMVTHRPTCVPGAQHGAVSV
jgi:hypothetical protein